MSQINKQYKIGSYTIEQINEEEFEVTYPYTMGGRAKATVCGGDFETAISTLFIGAKIDIKYGYEQINGENQ